MRSYTYILILCAGCKIWGSDKKGMQGALGFYEPNAYPADTASTGIGFERPLALGARADAWVLAPGVSSLKSATIDDPSIVSLSLTIYPIVLHGVSEGTTTLHVSTTSASDSLAVTVLRPDGARVWRPAEEGLSFGVDDSFFGKGAVYRAGASITVAAEPLAGSQPLLGFDLFQWTIDPPLLSNDGDGPGVNTRRMHALGQAGQATISTQLGGSLGVLTMASSEVPTLKIYRTPPDLSTPYVITALAPEDMANFAIGATDADGHYVVTSPQDPGTFHADVTSGTVTLLETKLTGHYVTMRACTGTGTVRIRYLGAELSVPIEVTSQVADKDCPAI